MRRRSAFRRQKTFRDRITGPAKALTHPAPSTLAAAEPLRSTGRLPNALPSPIGRSAIAFGQMPDC